MKILAFQNFLIIFKHADGIFSVFHPSDIIQALVRVAVLLDDPFFRMFFDKLYELVDIMEIDGFLGSYPDR